MSVARCKRDISRREFLQWRAYRFVHPYGEQRADDRIAYAFCQWANAHVQRGQKRFDVESFRVAYRSHVKPSVGELGAKLGAWFGAMKAGGVEVTGYGGNSSSTSG